MEYKILSEPDRPFVTVAVNVDVARELAIEFVKAATDEAIRLGNTRLLFDFRTVRSADDVFSKYDFATNLEAFAIPRSFRYAVVTDPDDASHDFAETVIRNRGYQIRFFKHMDEAQGWLLR
jgi:hypothetical protein